MPWTREHSLGAIHVYCQLPFGQFHQRNPSVIALATAMGRTPSSLAMKLSNFASLDPAHHARGIKGLDGASKQDRALWAELQRDWDGLAEQSARAFEALLAMAAQTAASTPEADQLWPAGDRGKVSQTTVEARIQARRGQAFFRAAVLAAYDNRCAVTGSKISEFLVASHIVPWAAAEASRLNPANGVCLSALYDRAFDRGLVSLDDGLRMLISRRLASLANRDALAAEIVRRSGQTLARPHRFSPDVEFLRWHRNGPFAEHN